MPLWYVLHPTTTFVDPESKAALVKDITAMYTDVGLPAFYVNVFFQSFQPEDVWVGGQPLITTSASPEARPRPFVRFQISHLAVHIKGEDWSNRRCEIINTALKPHIQDKGYDWEYHIDEPTRALWRINGLVAPPFKSEAEKKWFTDNVPTPWKEAESR